MNTILIELDKSHQTAEHICKKWLKKAFLAPKSITMYWPWPASCVLSYSKRTNLQATAKALNGTSTPMRLQKVGDAKNLHQLKIHQSSIGQLAYRTDCASNSFWVTLQTLNIILVDHCKKCRRSYVLGNELLFLYRLSALHYWNSIQIAQ